jgi:hypothetical protein
VEGGTLGAHPGAGAVEVGRMSAWAMEHPWMTFFVAYGLVRVMFELAKRVRR